MKKFLKYMIICIVLLFMYIPILVLAVYSFTDAANIGAIHAFSMHNYVTLFTTPELINMIIGSVLLAVGSELEGGERRHKNQVIDEVFVRLAAAGLADAGNLSETKSQSIMIGDRKDDILGSKASGIDSMGVRYGFAEEQELEMAGADYIVETVEDIRKKLKTL